MKQHKRWTSEEIDFLQENYGTKSLKAIANNLGRSISSVKNKANRLGLGDAKLHFDGITIRLLMELLNVEYGVMKDWINNHDLPVVIKVFAIKKRIKCINLNRFWKWAETHKELINFAELEPLILGKEPEWVDKKRAYDKYNYYKNHAV